MPTPKSFIQASCGVNIHAVFKNAKLDTQLLDRLKWVRGTLNRESPNLSARFAMEWSIAALEEAQASGMLTEYAAHDVLALATFIASPNMVELKGDTS